MNIIEYQQRIGVYFAAADNQLSYAFAGEGYILKNARTHGDSPISKLIPWEKITGKV